MVCFGKYSCLEENTMSIPKKIHFCWLSNDPFPPDVQKCMDSWKRVMPDYEIKHWNLKNFDVNIIKYAAQAMEKRKYAFVSDIVRLYALYTEGGIYLDSDVEVFRKFDDLLNNKAFTGFESGNRIGPWLIASEKGNRLIKELLDYYTDRQFCDKDGNMDLTPNTVPVTRILTKHGLKPLNAVQRLENITIYPEEYFCPKNPWTNEVTITENTYAMHYFAGVWNDNAKEEMKFVGEINDYINRFIKWKEKGGDRKNIIIYGTGVVGIRCFECLRQENISETVSCFMVTKRDNNWQEIDGVPIKEVASASDEDRSNMVLVGTNPKSHDSIGQTLDEHGFKNIYYLGTV